jgi:Cu/Ag efflux pump CusA
MYVNADLSVDLGEGVTVPINAVVPTGSRNFVFLDRGNGKLQPRVVQLGRQAGEAYQVLSGLKEGDRVVASANFLIDAESQVQGALQGFEQEPATPSPEETGPQNGLGAASKEPFDSLLNDYSTIQAQLAHDKEDLLKDSINDFDSDIHVIAGANFHLGSQQSLFRRDLKELDEATEPAFRPNDLEMARIQFGKINTSLDAVPDLSDVQVIIYTDWDGRSPDLVEDQITYPISARFISAPKVKFVRGESMFGKSFVYVIFEDGTDIYWARSRVLEYLNSARGALPPNVNPVLGPDATGVGWVYEYTLIDKSGDHSLADLRSFQDWTLRYALESVKGVSEVASVGGYVKQYQVDLNPNALVAYSLSVKDVTSAIQASNSDVGGKTSEVAMTEYYIRGHGYIRSIADIEDIVLKVQNGTPVFISNIATVHPGGDLRRGVAELDGKGEVVGGIVVMRYGENALNVVAGVQKKLQELKSSLPVGVEIVPTYDRSGIIKRAIATLREKLIEESIVVALVCIVFLWHVRSALVAIITLPVAIILSFVPMFLLGQTSNIMSLGGIAIAIGAMIDAAIIMVENGHKALEHFREEHNRDPDLIERSELLIAAAKAVGRPLFFSLLVITVSFIPVFSLTAQEGRLFRPLALTKTFAMFSASFLGITLVPVLMLWLIRGRITPEIMWSPATQAGADVMKRIAAPMIGGVVTSAILELLLYPVIYVIWRKRGLQRLVKVEKP